jgi:hypothetical protein
MKKHAGLLIALVSAFAAACGGSTSTGVGSSGSSGTSGTTDDAGTCATDPCDPGAGSSGSSGSSGTSGTSGSSGSSGAYDTPTVCTSGTTWTRGNRGSVSMHPGVACNQCHDQGGGPRLTIAGTIYPSAHEPDDCNGVGTGISVVVTDKNGKVTTIPVNSVGNFYSQAKVATPFTAKVVNGKSERAMIGPQTSGDCNTCHSVQGNTLAPGRIMAP